MSSDRVGCAIRSTKVLSLMLVYSRNSYHPAESQRLSVLWLRNDASRSSYRAGTMSGYVTATPSLLAGGAHRVI